MFDWPQNYQTLKVTFLRFAFDKLLTLQTLNEIVADDILIFYLIAIIFQRK